MKKIFTLLIGIVFSFTILNAQDAPPQAFSFKAMIKDRTGSPVVNRTVTLRISILQGAANGIVVYSERFRPTTNLYAQIDVEIGRGTVISGIFSAIDWGADEYYLKVEVDPKGGINFYVMSVSQLLSVPYALFAGNLSGGQDNDDNAENELISNAYLSGTVLTIVEGDRTTLVELSGLMNYFEDDDASPTNELQNLLLNGHELTIQNGNTITLPDEVNDADADPINEIQELSLEGNILTLTTSGAPIQIDLTPYLDNTDNQSLSLVGHELSILNGNTIVLPYEINDADADPLNEIQVLSLDGNVLTLTTNGSPIQIDLTPYLDNTDGQTLVLEDHLLTISNGNSIQIPDNVDDADSDPLNEIQQISIEGDRINLSRDGGYVEIPVANTVNGLFYYGDKDGDNYGDQFKAVWIPVNASPPAGYVSSSTDCNDSDTDINPGVDDICDGVDNDCDLVTDEDCQSPGCYQTLVQLFTCAEQSGCESNDAMCIFLYCMALMEQVQACEDGDCIFDLLMNPEDLPFDEGWSAEEKASYVIAQCTSPDVDKDGYSLKEGDCNDADPTIHPDATEICGDGIDQDCNGHDQICGDDDDDGYIEEAGDCNDADASIYPGAPDNCDNKDNDCDGSIDEDGDWATYYLDSDHDGYGNKDISESFCGRPPEDYVPDNDDCDDNNPEINPGAIEEEIENCSDGIDQDCSGADLPCDALTDDDSDGYSEVEGDCDDTNPAIYPKAPEICDDNIDQDCSGADVACSDMSDDDGDGWTEVGGDCDDTNPNLHPGAPEICDDNIDQNCDGNPNDGCCRPLLVQLLDCMDIHCTTVFNPMCVMEHCPNEYFMVTSCINIECIMNQLTDPGLPFNETWTNDQKAVYLLAKCSVKDEDGDTFAPSNGDCNDSDPSVYPGAPEICGDGIDQNCNGTDAGCDDPDEDGYTVATGDCNNNDPSIYPGAEELCDNKDNNCNSTIDEGLETRTWFRDADEDGYGSDEIMVNSCSTPEGYVEVAEDCDDNDPNIHLDAEELCDGKDNNCNGEIDEGAGDIWYLDADGDGYGISGDEIIACVVPDGYVDNPDDCDDLDENVHPFASEICGDGIDQNCDWEDASCPPEETDDDYDGYTELMGDCNDYDPTVFPGASEMCEDGTDQDCNGSDLSCLEVDNDGDGYSENQSDCNDFDPSVYPGAIEVCGDVVDQDCSGSDQLCPEDIDDDGDGFTEYLGDCDDTNSAIHPGAVEICGDGIDQDCDYYDLSCSDVDNDGDGFTENQDDCDDADPTIYFGAVEICGDGIDQDCNYSDLSCSDVDNDGDGFTENQGDCDDTDPAIYSGAIEICGDGIDQDCNYSDLSCLDVDNDGDGLTENQGDCDDTDPTIYSGAVEICGDGVDQDCWDSDMSCSDVDNDGDYYTENQGDCDDADPEVNPGAIELCGNGLDDDCSGGDMTCETTISNVIPTALTLSAGLQGTIYVILASPAGPSGVVVSVSTTNSCIFAPSTLTIPAGLSSAGVPVTALYTCSAAIVFTLGSQQVSVPVTVNP